MKRRIESIFELSIPGVRAHKVDPGSYYRESNFQVCFFPVNIMGMTKADWIHMERREPVFDRLETHQASECAFFCTGEAIMPFATMRDGKLDVESICLARIPAGTQVEIDAGVPHYIAVAATDTDVNVVFVHPEIDAPRIFLDEAVEGIEA